MGTGTLRRTVIVSWPLFLLVALIALGLYTFYSGPENNTFGSALIDDYFPLFL